MPSKKPKQGSSQKLAKKPAKSTPKSTPKPTSKPKPASKPAQKLTWQAKLKIAIIAIAVVAVVGYVAWDIVTYGPLMRAFENREELLAWVQSHGIFAPFAYMVLQIAQTVFAPIPGNIVGGIGGFLFGWWGVLWTTIGSAIGFWIVFAVSRRFGRPLVEKIIKKENLEKFDFIIGKRAPLILFIIFLIPGLPDDIIAYIAGLTDVRIKTLMALVILGRLPSVLVTNYLGMGLNDANVKIVGLVAAGAVILLLIIFWQRERIMDWAHQLSGRKGKSANDDDADLADGADLADNAKKSADEAEGGDVAED